MNVKCEVVRDIMPLYIDGVCSEESRKTVEEHLLSCKSCKEELGLMSAEIKTVTARADDKKIAKAAAKIIKKGKKKSFLIGGVVALCAVLILAGAYCGYHWFSSAPGDDLDALAQSAANYLHTGDLTAAKTEKRGNYLAALCKDSDGKWYMCKYQKDEIFEDRWVASGGINGFDPGFIASWHAGQYNYGSSYGEIVIIFSGAELSDDARFYTFENNGIAYLCPIENNTVLDIFIVPDGNDIHGDPTVLDENQQPLKKPNYDPGIQ